MSQTRPDRILLVDAGVNLVLGVLLVWFPAPVVEWLGLPSSGTGFYARILGAVFIGIAGALALGARKPRSGDGLGAKGAAFINLAGGTALALMLAFGRVCATTTGTILLWALVVVLVLLSSMELATRSRKGEKK
jgi:hypothetical protein